MERAGIYAKREIPRMARVKKLYDKDIRPALCAYLKRKFGSRSFHTEEVGLGKIEKASSGLKDISVRMDYLVVNTKRMVGVEIKSDYDTQDRLYKQQRYYSYFCDLCAICITDKHFDGYGIMHIPDWWAILLARREGNKVVIHEQRPFKENPIEAHPSVLANFLWKGELAEYVARHSKNDKGFWKKNCNVDILRVIAFGFCAREYGVSDLAKFTREKIRERLDYRKHLIGRYT